MSWYLAKSLVVLRDQINEKYPGRSKISDGAVGNAEHSARTSDHNPTSTGQVCAIDITHDPAHGLDIATLSDTLYAAKDPRIKYIIANGYITSPNGLNGAKWVKYNGTNPHTKHIHISVYSGATGDNTAAWNINGTTTTTKEEPDMDATQNQYLSEVRYQTLATVAPNVVATNGAVADIHKRVDALQKSVDKLIELVTAITPKA